MSDDTAETISNESRHVSVWIDVSAATADAFISDVDNLPRWAAGVDTAEVTVEFSPANPFGVLDHVVRLASGESFYNPMRVLPGEDGQDRCEVVFTVRRRPGMSDQEFEVDVAAVNADLHTLRDVLEG